MTTPKQAMIYCRFTLDNDSQMQQQERICRETAESQGLTVNAVFKDVCAGSSELEARPGWSELMSALASEQHSCMVIVASIQRLSRSAIGVRNAVAAIRAAGGHLSYADSDGETQREFDLLGDMLALREELAETRASESAKPKKSRSSE